MTNQNLKAPHVIELSVRERAAALITPLESTFRPIAPQCSFNVAMNTYRARFSIHGFFVYYAAYILAFSVPGDFSPVC